MFAQERVRFQIFTCAAIYQLIDNNSIHALESQGLYSNLTKFYDFLEHRSTIIFKPRFQEVDDSHPEFSLILGHKQHYNTVSSC